MQTISQVIIWTLLLSLCSIGAAQVAVTWLPHSAITAGKSLENVGKVQFVTNHVLSTTYTSTYFDGVYYNYFYNVNFGKTFTTAPDIVISKASIGLRFGQLGLHWLYSCHRVL